MPVQFRYGLLQHLAVTRVAGCLQLLPEAFPGKKQTLAFTVTLLLVGRERCASGLPLR
ncbi:MAG: hypothetical protein WCA13_08680 [Terriglobales bacterium]